MFSTNHDNDDGYDEYDVRTLAYLPCVLSVVTKQAVTQMHLSMREIINKYEIV